MTDKSNLYFFREEEGYTPAEVEQRIQVADLRDNPSAVKRILDECGISDELLEKSKDDILGQIQREVDTGRYEQFMDELLEDRGEKGDRVNVQVYKLIDIEREELQSTIENADSDDTTDYLLRNLDYSKERKSINAIDFKFKISDIGDYFSGDNVEVVGDQDKVVMVSELMELSEQKGVFDDLDIDSINAFRERSELIVEARLYLDYNLLFVSNREIWDRLQTEIRDHVNKWGGSSAPVGSFNLRETELLYIQNVMGGDNSGLDFGDFLDGNLSTAKYRGPRQESLTLSPVLRPAQHEGQITQVRFYRQYESWPVQVRVHGDGHITTTKPTRPDFIDEIATHIDQILQWQKYLTPIDDLISEYKALKQRNSSHFNERSYRKTRKNAFKSLIDEYVVSESYGESEKQVYASIIANVILDLGKLGLSDSAYPDPPSLDVGDFPDDQREIKSFIDDYFTLKLEEAPPDFEEVWEHMHYILTKEFTQPDDTPLDIVMAADQKYNIHT
ncbi:hypothetical protein [Halovivax gelatinilyticus]|uniref:hypothetical protein n=1 Tax=Halovivax gelatinilyticus TaxID=2961597 RepID=UPI0020CA3777|nr:hypothetical protein [Halovivax gelatinilyticus]